jgi:hypothetical protein
MDSIIWSYEGNLIGGGVDLGEIATFVGYKENDLL